MSRLYTPTVLEHFRHPRNFGSLPDADGTHEAFNPLCGDRIRVEVKVDEGRVIAARFRGDACAICVATASLLTERARGMTAEEIGWLGRNDAVNLLDAELPEGRVQCALLPLTALQAAVCIRTLSSKGGTQ